METLLSLKKALGTRSGLWAVGEGQYLTNGKTLVRVRVEVKETRDETLATMAETLFPPPDGRGTFSLEFVRKVLPESTFDEPIFPLNDSRISWSETVSVRKDRKNVDEIRTYGLWVSTEEKKRGVWISPAEIELARKAILGIFGPYRSQSLTFYFHEKKEIVFGFLNPGDSDPFVAICPVNMGEGQKIFSSLPSVTKFLFQKMQG